MSYCKYHPLQAATNTCKTCCSNLCHECVHTNEFDDHSLCLLCNDKTESLGASVDVTPFWRRIDKSFHYPLDTSVLIFIVSISLISSVSTFLFFPITIGINLLTTGIILKYCFNCLSATAMGQMKAPDITSAYQGGVLLVLRLLFAIAVLFGIVFVLDTYVSASFAALIGFGIVIAFPAMIILYAMTESLLAALNPIKLTSLISNIGLPYCLILAILIIMFGSVELLSEMIGYQSSVISLTLQSAISNYYSIVMFNLMGYMIFQYQHRLGYIAEESIDEPTQKRSEQKENLAKIQVLTKEGRWTEVEKLYRETLKKYPNEDELQHRYFLYTLSVKINNNRNITQIIDDYMSYLIRSKQTDKLNLSYKRARTAFPDYQPTTPLLRHEIAKACYDSGSPKIAAKLLLDLHKAYPNYFHLIAAYEVLIKALDEIPGMAAKAMQYRKLIIILKECTTEQNAEQKPVDDENLNQKPSDSLETKHSHDNLNTVEPPQETDTQQTNQEEVIKKDLPPIEFK